jgi:excisionase family DNA binding protein
MAAYSTAQVADILGIGTDTLHRWLKEKKVAAPKLSFVGGVKVRLWSETDLDAARVYKAEHYWGKGARRKRRNRKELT